jgi:heme-degrading monooxygenase HmoA
MQEENNKNFVAINYIKCKEDYRERFEELFATRAKAIDRLTGFKFMEVLKPQDDGDNYLIVSHWEVRRKHGQDPPNLLKGTSAALKTLK